MDRLPSSCRLAQQMGVPCAGLLLTGSIGGAVATGESSRVHLLRCTALDAPEHAFAPCALQYASA